MKEWKVKEGNTSIQEFPVYDRKGALVTDLEKAAKTGYIKFQVKKKRSDTTPMIEKTAGKGIQVDVPKKGWLTITLLPKDTGIDNGEYKMALEIKWTDDKLYETRIFIRKIETTGFVIEPNLIKA